MTWPLISSHCRGRRPSVPPCPRRYLAQAPLRVPAGQQANFREGASEGHPSPQERWPYRQSHPATHRRCCAHFRQPAACTRSSSAVVCRFIDERVHDARSAPSSIIFGSFTSSRLGLGMRCPHLKLARFRGAQATLRSRAGFYTLTEGERCKPLREVVMGWRGASLPREEHAIVRRLPRPCSMGSTWGPLTSLL